MADKKWQTIW